jgi:hypothetical protein
MCNFGTPWGLYKCIETNRSEYNVCIVEIRNIYIYIQGVTGGMDQTSGECSLC